MKIKLEELKKTYLSKKDMLNNEQSTKLTLVHPFLEILNYNVRDPAEVSPEYEADVANKKREKVDYAILKDGVPVILIECKKISENLDQHLEQLERYFPHVPTAKLGILTNGIKYRFFKDNLNILDKDYFIEFDISDFNDDDIKKLQMFKKEEYNYETIHSEANKLKFIEKIKHILIQESDNPSKDFVSYIFKKITDGRVFNDNRYEEFKKYVKESFSEYKKSYASSIFNNDYLKQAEELTSNESNVDELDIKEEKPYKLELNIDELIAFEKIKAICFQNGRKFKYVKRQNYLSIKCNGRSFAWIDFNDGKKNLIIDKNGNSKIDSEEIIKLKTLDDIFNFSNELNNALEIKINVK